MKSYIALLRKSGTEFAVAFPDLPGCEAVGATMENVRADAAHSLALYLQQLVATGDAIPAPSSLMEIVSDPNWRSDSVDAILLSVRPVARTGESER